MFSVKPKNKYSLIFSTLMGCGALTAAIPAHATVTLLDKDEWKVGIYGFAEADAIFDTTRSLSENAGNAGVAVSPSLAGDNGRTQFSVRNSRLGFAVDAPKMSGWTTRMVAEFDFFGINNDEDPQKLAGGASPTPTEGNEFNSPTLRIRHFYGVAENNGWQFLGGQYWTLFGWQPTYILASVSVSPVAGTLFERTTQFTTIKTFDIGDAHKASVGLSITRPAQRDSQVPGLDFGARWAWSGYKAGFTGLSFLSEAKAQPLSVAVSGRLQEYKINNNPDFDASNDYLGSAFAADALIPIIGSSDGHVSNTLTLTGEFSIGQGYAEAFPSWSGGTLNSFGKSSNTQANLDAGQAGVDGNGNVQLIHLQTFNFQAQYHLPMDIPAFVTAGYGQLWSDNIDSLGASGEVYDRAETYFLNAAYNCSKQFRVAAEYSMFLSSYNNGDTGHDDRYQVSTYFYF